MRSFTKRATGQPRRAFRAEQLEDRLLLSINSGDAVSGDYNADEVVDASDLAVWQVAYGSTESLVADGNCNGIVDGQDFLIWQRNLGVQSNVDFGDAPEPYPTTLAEDGARHVAVGPFLGAGRSTEADGVPSLLANSDGGDDGVVFGSLQVGALNATVVVHVQDGPAKLDAWVDFNGDGSFGGFGEQIFTSVDVASGDNQLELDIPSFATAGERVARFRLSTAGDLGPSGSAADGEVEDYVIPVLGPTLSTGTFETQPTISDSTVGASNVFAADFNGDGHMDVVASRGDELVWFENDGAEDFSERDISTFDANVSETIAADLDGDGDVDVISATNFQNGVQNRGVFWHENDGDGNFTRRLASNGSAVLRVERLFVADVDGDGDQDVIATTNSTSGNNINWLENNGSQQFAVRTVGAASFGQGVFAADVDSDGDVDVLSASRNDDTIAWYENDGAGVFEERVISTQANGARGVFAIDVDGDGDTDVLSASNQDSKVAWYENDGNQVFTERIISTTDRGTFRVFAADFDGDGDVDVLSSATGDGDLLLHVNDGNQNFTERTVGSGLAGARKIFAADIDGDGDLDALAASNTSGDSLPWFENVNAESEVQVFDFGADRASGIDSATFADVASSQLNADDVVFDEPTRATTISRSGFYINNSSSPSAVQSAAIAAQVSTLRIGAIEPDLTDSQEREALSAQDAALLLYLVELDVVEVGVIF